MHNPNVKTGFTIVELLIVIVVIAILAAISVVAYTGIQNRAYDSSVSSDLTNLAKQFEIAKINSTTDSYPVNDAGISAAFTFKVSKSAYAISPTPVRNIVVCAPSASNAQQFLILAESKSGNQFSIRNGGSVQKDTGDPWSVNAGAATTICQGVQSGWIGNAVGYLSSDTTTGPWRAWAGGN